MGLTDQLRPVVPKDVAQELGTAGVRRLLQLMADAYRDLHARKYVTPLMSEWDINEEWFMHIQSRWRETPAISLIPIPEKPDRTKAKPRGKPPTIDFCFRDRFDNRSYFGAECKLLDQGNATHLAEYLSQGVQRFLDGKYAAHTWAGTMIGYVRSGKCSMVADLLRREVRSLPNDPDLKRSAPLKDFDQLYESHHSRTCPISSFLCYHMLFAFS